MMPFITSQFLPREKGDRPDVIPKGSNNLAFMGQFCELPGGRRVHGRILDPLGADGRLRTARPRTESRRPSIMASSTRASCIGPFGRCTISKLDSCNLREPRDGVRVVLLARPRSGPRTAQRANVREFGGRANSGGRVASSSAIAASRTNPRRLIGHGVRQSRGDRKLSIAHPVRKSPAVGEEASSFQNQRPRP